MSSSFIHSASDEVEVKAVKRGDPMAVLSWLLLALVVTVQTEIVLWVSGQHLLGKEKVIL